MFTFKKVSKNLHVVEVNAITSPNPAVSDGYHPLSAGNSRLYNKRKTSLLEWRQQRLGHIKLILVHIKNLKNRA